MFPSNGMYVCRGTVKDKVTGEERPCECTRPIGGATIVKTSSQEKEIGILSENPHETGFIASIGKKILKGVNDLFEKAIVTFGLENKSSGFTR